MEKHINEKYQESYYSETLSNGLHVVLWKKEDYAKSLFMMSTPLGAMDLEQVDEAGKHYCYHAGIAHFLEHKMFEMGEQDVMELFPVWVRMSMPLLLTMKQHIIFPQATTSKSHWNC